MEKGADWRPDSCSLEEKLTDKEQFSVLDSQGHNALKTMVMQG